MVALLALVGYFSNARSNQTVLFLYIILTSVSSLFFAFIGLGFILVAERVDEPIRKDWAHIDTKLKEAGYDMSEKTFATIVEINLKFAGLFSIVFCCFLFIGLFPALYLRSLLREKADMPPATPPALAN